MVCGYLTTAIDKLTDPNTKRFVFQYSTLTTKPMSEQDGESIANLVTDEPVACGN